MDAVPELKSKKPTPADVQQAYRDAFDPVKGKHVDPRTGEPLLEKTRNGSRGWDMRYDPVSEKWVAWNKQDGYGRGYTPRPITFPDYDPRIGARYPSGDGLAPGEPHPHTPPETHDPIKRTDGIEYVNRGNTGETKSAKIERWLRFQEQITGWLRDPDGKMPEYTLYDSKGTPVRLDGRQLRGYPPQEVFLDAKQGHQVLHYAPNSGIAKGMQDRLVAEAKRQLAVLPKGAKLEWHISTREAADAISNILADEKIYGVDVIYTPER
jgi:hypothetical protein